ncbi:MAG TPA: VanZ family protein [Alphaproteobacteria bacterium]|nr:VanZ family protein [Alphaproteobacteria bacterium]
MDHALLDLDTLPTPLRIAAGAALVIATAAIAAASLTPSLAPPGEFGIDKLLHALGFAGLAVLATAAFRGRGTHLFAYALLLAVGAGIEVAQSWVPGRQGSLLDLLADGAGLLLGAAAAGRMIRAARRPR